MQKKTRSKWVILNPGICISLNLSVYFSIFFVGSFIVPHSSLYFKPTTRFLAFFLVCWVLLAECPSWLVLCPFYSATWMLLNTNHHSLLCAGYQNQCHIWKLWWLVPYLLFLFHFSGFWQSKGMFGNCFFPLFSIFKNNFLFFKLKNLFGNSKWTENKNCF